MRRIITFLLLGTGLLCLFPNSAALSCNTLQRSDGQPAVTAQEEYDQKDNMLCRSASNTPVKTICLTFDDGPTDSTTPQILDILHAARVHATFFVIGRQIRNREKIIKRTNQEGHAIGIHTFSHQYSAIYASPAALQEDIRRCRAEILRVLPDYQSKLYRFPGGEYGSPAEIVQTVRKSKLIVCGWNASVDDAVRPNADADDLFESAVRSAAGRNHVVLLLHDGVGYRATVKSLPRIIQYFQKQGYRFARMDEVPVE